MNRNIVILAGGASSRMKNSADASSVDEQLIHDAKTKSKAMLTVGSRPFLDYVLHNVELAGYQNIVIVVGQNDESVKEYYVAREKASEFRNLTFTFVPQKIPDGRVKPLGTADALLQALLATPQWSGQRFTVCNSDNLYSTTALKLLLDDDHDNAMIDYDSSTLKFSQERIAQFGAIKKDNKSFVVNIIEKPSNDELQMLKDINGRIGVSMNIWRFTYEQILPFLKAIPLHPLRQEKELPVAAKMMIEQQPKSLFAIPLSEHVLDLTTISDIPSVEDELRNMFPNFQR